MHIMLDSSHIMLFLYSYSVCILCSLSYPIMLNNILQLLLNENTHNSQAEIKMKHKMRTEAEKELKTHYMAFCQGPQYNLSGR